MSIVRTGRNPGSEGRSLADAAPRTRPLPRSPLLLVEPRIAVSPMAGGLRLTTMAEFRDPDAPAASNVLLAYGHGHLGPTLAASTTRAIADLAARRTPPAFLDLCSPARSTW